MPFIVRWPWGWTPRRRPSQARHGAWRWQRRLLTKPSPASWNRRSRRQRGAEAGCTARNAAACLEHTPPCPSTSLAAPTSLLATTEAALNSSRPRPSTRALLDEVRRLQTSERQAADALRGYGEAFLSATAAMRTTPPARVARRSKGTHAAPDHTGAPGTHHIRSIAASWAPTEVLEEDVRVSPRLLRSRSPIGTRSAARPDDLLISGSCAVDRATPSWRLCSSGRR